MASTYSSNLKIELMGTGENAGTWGNITNTNLGTALEQAVVGLGNPDFVADANLTITLTDSNAAQAARALVLNVTSGFGSLTVTRELVVPTSQKQYIVQNNTTGGQSITVKTSGGTGITVPNGRKAHLYVDGTNVIQMFDFVDINGGAIDGTVIGGAAAAAGSFTTLGASGAATVGGTLGVTGLLTATGGVSGAVTSSSVTVTGGTINGTTIGASTASTGAFTTLASSSTTTLNGTTIPVSSTLVTTAATQTITGKTISADDNTLSGIAASSFVLSNGSGNIDGSAAQKAIPSGAVVGTTDTQTLTGKTISADDNTLSGIAASSFVLSNGSGNIDGSAAQKAIPSGAVVGTTDTQTLTGKTLSTGTAITAGTIDGTTIGVTSASTGAFTTLSTTGALTYGGVTLSNSVTGTGSMVLQTSPSLTTPALGTPTAGVLSACTVDGTDSVGFRNAPINSRSADYTLVLADSGKTIFHPASDNNARTFTIPANSSVAYAVGTVVSFINLAAADVTIAITTDTMYLGGDGATGSRTLAEYGIASALKVSSTDWVISGNGLT